MIILKRKTTTEEIELGHGVFLDVVPAGKIDYEMAEAEAKRRIAACMLGRESLARYGVADFGAAKNGDGSTEADMAALLKGGSHAIACELGVRQIKAWRGAMVAETIEAELTPENIGVLFNEWAAPDISFGTVFLVKIARLKTLKVSPDTKKDSAASPAISGVVAASTAASAQPSAIDAREASLSADAIAR